MSVESLFPRLEPLLPAVQKPIQYVGGELNSSVKDWDEAQVRWALMYPDAYEVGLPNQGVQILYELLNERDGVLAERTYSVWPDLEALMREHEHPAVHRGRAPAGRGLRRARDQFLHRARLHQHADRARPRRHPAARGGPYRRPPDRARRRPRGLQPRAGRRLPRRRRARRRRGDRARDHRGVREWKARGPARRPRRAADAPGRAPAASTSRGSTTSSYLPDGRIQRVAPNRPGVPWRVAKHTVMDLDAVAVPQEAPGARSPRPCTSGSASRSSAAARAAAGSARPA